MKKIVLLFLAIVICSCSRTTSYSDPDVSVTDLQSDFSKWWTYHYKSINLSQDFTALDIASNIVSKEAFLKALTTGDYIPVKLQSEHQVTYYKLYPINKTTETGLNISNTIRNTSGAEYDYFKMEGKDFPDFQFEDLNGKVYNKENTRGKTIVLKCWFVACIPCVAEMPELNKLVKRYQDRKDVVFVSLTLDSGEKLSLFLQKRTFDYAVVPNQKTFIADSLKVTQFPTHFIINKNATIRKVVSRYQHLSTALAKN